MKSLSDPERSRVVTDTGPLIALASCQYLHLLSLFFDQVLIPETVMNELCLQSDFDHVSVLRHELEKNAVFRVVSAASINQDFVNLLDPGEAEALALAAEHGSVLLIDERKGRKVACKHGIAILGTGRLLVAAKKRGAIGSVNEALQQLRSNGYRLSDALCVELLRLAGE